jgi:hypothetical protein
METFQTCLLTIVVLAWCLNFLARELFRIINRNGNWGRGPMNVTLFTPAGIAVRSWINVQSFDCETAGNHVLLRDPAKNKDVSLTGIVVAEEASGDDKPQKHTHKVQLFGDSKTPLRSWLACELECKEGRTEFVECKHGRRVVVLGTTLAEQVCTSCESN